MTNPDSAEMPNHLSLKDFMSQLASLSFDVTPELEKIQEILRLAESREKQFAIRLEGLKQQILQLETGDGRRGRLTPREESMVEIITLYHTITLEKEKVVTLQEEVADKIVEDLIKTYELDSELMTPTAQDSEPDEPSSQKN